MILFDTPRWDRFRGRQVWTCHLMSDTLGVSGTAELDAFAIDLGLKPKWRQNSGTPREHYDVFGQGIIDRAIALGAVQVEPRELIRRVVWPKRDALRSRRPGRAG